MCMIGLCKSMLPHSLIKDEIDKEELREMKTDLEEKPIALHSFS